jgi:epoxyqueuosine reductase QueG
LLYADLLSFAASLGAFRFGVADLEALAGLPTQPAGLLSPYRRGISLAVRLDDTVVDELLPKINPRPGEPTPAYARLYAQANGRLDEMATRLVRFIQGRGYRAEAIPASETLLGHSGALPHKAVARQAGLGWIGRNLLLIVPGIGPRLRLSTVLTDALLPPGAPVSGDCGPCRACIKVCPTEALRLIPYEEYPPRGEALDVARCSDYLYGFARSPAIGRPVCGMCMAVCPGARR